MIVATAGHVDHGKTSLVKALTGVDTDRLEEEKRRGMSIDLGFAYTDMEPGATVGFVDVPGHERFIRNMLAGVAAIDFGLVVIAADDGPMPQTVEHLTILDSLGISYGAVALTKIDRVSDERIAEVRHEAASLLANTTLRGAPVFPLVATTGEGIQPLRAHLAAMCRHIPIRSASGNFRMAVDRCFSVPGTGLVVTGAVFSGSIATGQEIVISPCGVVARVRGIHAMSQEAASANAGQRCALNLTGGDLKRIAIARGDWVVAPSAHAPANRLDVEITVCADEPDALRHWTPVHLHIGAASLTARLVPIEKSGSVPQRSALAQLVLDTPTIAVRGDRFILRDQSARRTIAGGIVLDPFGPVRGRSKPPRLAQLAALKCPTPELALSALLDADSDGVNLDWFGRVWNMTPAEMSTLSDALPIVFIDSPEGVLGMSRGRWLRLCDAVGNAIQRWHAEHPDSIGPVVAQLAVETGLAGRSAVLHAAIKSLIERGFIVRDGLNLRERGHRATLPVSDQMLLNKIEAVLKADGIRPPIVGELAKAIDIEQSELTVFLERMARLGHLVRIAKNRFFLPHTVGELAAIASQLAGESATGTFDAATFRDRSGIGRNLTIEVLEFFDRAGLTRFFGGKRRMAQNGRISGSV